MCVQSLTALIINVLICKWPPWRWPTEVNTWRSSITK